MDDEERREWLVAAVASQARMYALNESGHGQDRYIRGLAFLGAAREIELINGGDFDRLAQALQDRLVDDFAFRDLLD